LGLLTFRGAFFFMARPPLEPLSVGSTASRPDAAAAAPKAGPSVGETLRCRRAACQWALPVEQEGLGGQTIGQRERGKVMPVLA
jgi:hypothetical protein